ncbi:MAG: DUF2892 domain-containing protein [Bacteroidota bacterium]
MGTVDRVIRILLTLVLIVFYLIQLISGATAISLLLFGGILILTSSISYCPMYAPFKFSTKKKK